MDSKKFTKKQKRALAYAIIFLINNWDDDCEEELEMTEEEFRKVAVSTDLVTVE